MCCVIVRSDANGTGVSRTLIYLEAEASMNVYEDKNGQTQSSLSLVQSKVEVLKRPYNKEETTQE